jgi:hypothetical protein
MARVLLVADPLFAATADNDAPEARSGQTSDDTLSAPEPHRARGHGLDLLRPHAEKNMLKLETETEMMPAQPRSDASYVPEQAQVEEQFAPQSRDPGHARQQTQSLAQQQSQQQLLLLTQLQQTSADAAAASAQPQLVVAHASDQAQELQAAAQTRALAHAELQTQHPVLQQPQQQTLTGGRGVDLVVDQVSGGTINAALRATAILGRIVKVGRLGGMHGDFDFDLHATRRIAYIGVTHRTRSVAEIREEERVARRDLRKGVDEGVFRLPIDRVFALDEAVEALAHMKANAHLGKIILKT